MKEENVEQKKGRRRIITAEQIVAALDSISVMDEVARALAEHPAALDLFVSKIQQAKQAAAQRPRVP